MNLELLNNLSHFTGSSMLFEHRIHNYKLLYTEGVKYLAEQAKCYWLLDYICSLQTDTQIKAEPFQTWCIENVGDFDVWIIAAEDGNGKTIHFMRLEFSDFPLNQLKLFYCNNTLLLPSEY